MNVYHAVLDLFKEEFVDRHYRGIGKPYDGATHQKSYYYRAKTNSCCIIGRLLQHPENFHDSSATVKALLLTYGTKILKPEYRDLDPDFLQDLQCLHDDDKYWLILGGLSYSGRCVLADLYKEVANGCGT